VKHKLLFPLLVSILGTETATLFLKNWFDRARPTFIPTEDLTASFPSAHASISIGFYAYLAYILIKFGNEKYRPLIAAIVTLIIILIGFSRVYLTVHYPSDVVVGYIVGILFFGIGVAITEAQFKEIEEEIEEIEEDLGVNMDDNGEEDKKNKVGKKSKKDKKNKK
jgi:undecaprenyl-diphosphatase